MRPTSTECAWGSCLFDEAGTGKPNPRCAVTAASIAPLPDGKAAHTPSPVCLNNQPPWPSIAARNTSSCAAKSTRIASGSVSHRRVEPSISVNKNVTVPDGRTLTPHPSTTTSQQSATRTSCNPLWCSNCPKGVMPRDSPADTLRILFRTLP